MSNWRGWNDRNYSKEHDRRNLRGGIVQRRGNEKEGRNVALCISLTLYLQFWFTARVLASKFYFFRVILCSYDYSMHVEGLLPANLCLVNLFNIPANNEPWCSVSEFTSSTGSIHVNSPDTVNKFGMSTWVSREITSFFTQWHMPVKPYQFWPRTTRVNLIQNSWQQAEHVYSCEYTWKHVLVEQYQLWTSMTCANWFTNGSLFAGMEPCSQFERFHLQHVQIIHKTSSFKTKLH